MRQDFVALMAFIGILVNPSSALAAVKLTQIHAKHTTTGLNIDLTFDQPVLAKNFKQEFDRNFVQFVLKSTKTDIARLIPVVDSEIQKIFAYPYNSDTTRLRLILKSDNKWAKGKVTVWNNNPKSVRIFVKEPKIEVFSGTQKAFPAKAAKGNVAAPAKTAAVDPEEAELINEVVKNTKEIDIHNPDSVKAALETKTPAKVIEVSNDNKSLGTKVEPSKHFVRMFVSLLGILAVFFLGVFGFKKYIGKMGKLPFGKKERLIQMVASHYLGNKKSIALVKIANEYMVVGVANDGVSLISKFGPEFNVDKYLEDRFWGGTFEKHLDSYSKDIKVKKEIDFSTFDGAKDLNPQAALGTQSPMAFAAPEMQAEAATKSVRASIKEKLSGLKTLS